MTIGLTVALEGEYKQMLGLLGGRSEGSIGANRIIVRHSGMGKVNAALGAQAFINEYPLDCLISSGVAGGLSHELRSLDLVAASQVVYHDVWCGEGNAYGQVQGLPERFDTCDPLLAKAAQAGAKTGLFASGDFFISTSAEAQAILDHFPEAIAVDMESGAIAQTCHIHGVPFLSLRIISDVAGEDHQAEYDNFWKTVADDSFEAVRRFLESLPEKI
ncbi:MAG: 5'-methylthioadenosine/S-adenosylhomocysteine nucleosidase [Bacteroidales bacterium]|nr:5'-methylthioadenosine/S-adenosylhomocysteine nucleosidase [Bacteroidales bacterium]